MRKNRADRGNEPSDRNGDMNPEAPLHVLLVEANPLDRILMKQLADDCRDIRFTPCKRLQEAFEQLSNSNSYDAVILEPARPEAFGSESLRKLQETCRKTPVLICTGNRDPDLDFAPDPAIVVSGADELARMDRERDVLGRPRH